MNRLFSLSKIIFINMAVLFVLLVVFELAMGRWLGINSFRDLNIPVSQPFSMDTSDVYPGGGLVKFHTDRYGFRSGGASPENIDILAVGGSTTRESMIADGKTWTDVMANALSAAQQKKITVANAGIDAQSTFGNIRAFDIWFPKVPGLNPKAVILFIGINDQARESPIGFDDFSPKSTAQKIENYIFNNSALYEFYRKLRGIYRAYVTRVVHMAPSPVSGGEMYSVAPSIVYNGDLSVSDAMRIEYRKYLASYRERIGILVEKVRKMGATSIIVNQLRGDLSEYGGEIRYKAISGYVLQSMKNQYLLSKLYADEAMQTCRDLNAVCVDLASELPIPIDERYDLVHTTPEGSERIGQYLAQKLHPLIGDMF